jgi:hypothetical protein
MALAIPWTMSSDRKPITILKRASLPHIKGGAKDILVKRPEPKESDRLAALGGWRGTVPRPAGK